MDSLSSQSFPDQIPFKEPIVITHYVSMVVAFLGCYPLLLTQQLRRKKVYILSLVVFFALIGFISACFIQLTHQSTTSNINQLLGFTLSCILYLQFSVMVWRSGYFLERSPTFHSTLDHIFHNAPSWIDKVLGWLVLILALFYMAVAAMVFTESCTQDTLQSQCLMPISMGMGFLIYGTFVLLHLLAIVKLPRPSTPEYYEGVVLTFWGFISLLLSGTPILGSKWKALNLGVLWFSGGLFSISITLQTWFPALRERNIVNALVICLTGRAIVRGITQIDDTYTTEVHTMLGYVFIVGGLSRIALIVFRKSPSDNLPHHMFQNSDILDVDDDEDDIVLSKETPRCKHRFIFASITLVSGLLTSFLSIGGGILLMGANVGWIRYMRYYITDPSTYVNLALAMAFLWSAYVFGLCTVYKNLKVKNALLTYEYLELEQTPALEQHDEESREWSKYHEEEVTLMAVSSPIQYDQNPSRSTSPTELINSPQRPAEPEFYQNPNFTEIPSVDKPIRPSEYRAKRRSLLIQPHPLYTAIPTAAIVPQPPNPKNKRASTFGVGGILPDEIIQSPQQESRRSWLSSSGSSVGHYSGSIDSSAPNSPLTDQPYSSLSSTLPNNHTQVHPRSRSHSETGFFLLDDEKLKKTRGIKQKERLQQLQDDGYTSDYQSLTKNNKKNKSKIDDKDIVLRTGFQQRWSQQSKKSSP